MFHCNHRCKKKITSPENYSNKPITRSISKDPNNILYININFFRENTHGLILHSPLILLQYSLLLQNSSSTNASTQKMLENKCFLDCLITTMPEEDWFFLHYREGLSCIRGGRSEGRLFQKLQQQQQQQLNSLLVDCMKWNQLHQLEIQL